ncbi:hypothetical protein BGX34_004668 [Mortierella sp. NVP85]|nr:hypothetical protein BGX34_004668 [Mortierella sp. NVP85]
MTGHAPLIPKANHDVIITLDTIPYTIKETEERVLIGSFYDEEHRLCAVTVFMARILVQEEPMKSAYDLLVTLKRANRYKSTIVKASGKMTVISFIGKTNWYHRLDATEMSVVTEGPVIKPLDDDDIPTLSKFQKGGAFQELQKILRESKPDTGEMHLVEDTEKRRRGSVLTERDKDDEGENTDDGTRDLIRSLSNVSWDDPEDPTSSHPHKKQGITSSNSPFVKRKGASASASGSGSALGKSRIPTPSRKPKK